MSDVNINDQLICILGDSASGKSASLQNIPNQDRWLYLNCEAGKRLPFKNQFQNLTVSDPYQIYEAFDVIKPGGDMEGQIDGIIIDTITFMMDMMESVHVLPAEDTQKAWGDYAQFFKNLMQQRVSICPVPVLMLSHVKAIYNEKTLSYDVKIPVKGQLQYNGLESFFSTIVSTKKMELEALEDYQNGMLNISQEDEMLGYKHVFQTKLTKATVGERIRSPIGMFTTSETYIDNDASILLDHMKKYYGN